MFLKPQHYLVLNKKTLGIGIWIQPHYGQGRYVPIYDYLYRKFIDWLITHREVQPESYAFIQCFLTKKVKAIIQSSTLTLRDFNNGMVIPG